MNRLFLITAALTLALGSAWLLAPAAMLASLGLDAGPSTTYVARRYAALFFGYSVLCWLARHEGPSPARTAILAGSFVVTILMAGVSLLGTMTATGGPALWGAAAVEVALATGFGWFLFTPSRGK